MNIQFPYKESITVGLKAGRPFFAKIASNFDFLSCEVMLQSYKIKGAESRQLSNSTTRDGWAAETVAMRNRF